MRRPRTRPPWTVLVYLAVVGANVVAALVPEGAHGRWVGGGLLLVLASLGLAGGVWLAWLFLTLVAAGDIVLALLEWPPGGSSSSRSTRRCSLCSSLAPRGGTRAAGGLASQA